jgi:hypothetical protein
MNLTEEDNPKIPANCYIAKKINLTEEDISKIPAKQLYSQESVSHGKQSKNSLRNSFIAKKVYLTEEDNKEPLLNKEKKV